MPRPRAPIAFRFHDAPDRGLHVVSLRRVDILNAAATGATADVPKPLQRRVAYYEAAASALRWDDTGEPIVGSAGELGMLPSHEADRLVDEANDAVVRVTPSCGSAELRHAWGIALDRGASDSPSDAWALGGCVDVAFGVRGQRHFAPRPDRYFGQPLGALCDAHWTVFWVAHSYVMSKQARQ